MPKLRSITNWLKSNGLMLIVVVLVVYIAYETGGCVAHRRPMSKEEVARYIVGKPKEFFYGAMGLPVNERVGLDGLEYVEWQGVSSYFIPFKGYVPLSWKIVVQFKDGVCVGYSKPQGYAPPPFLTK